MYEDFHSAVDLDHEKLTASVVLSPSRETCASSRFCSATANRIHLEHVFNRRWSPKEPQPFMLAVGVWNGGRYRGWSKQMEVFRGSTAWHVLLSQEFDGDDDAAQLAHLRSMNMACFVRNTSLIASRDHLVKSFEFITETDDDYIQFLIAKVIFKNKVAGLSDLICGTVHMHNDKVGDKKQVGSQRWADVLVRCFAHKCDVIGYDANQSMVALQEILNLMNQPAMILRCPDKDCVGMILPPCSRLLTMRQTQFVHFELPRADLGWGNRDRDSHYALKAIWRPVESKNKRHRAEQTEKDRNKRRDQGRKRRKLERRTADLEAQQDQ